MSRFFTRERFGRPQFLSGMLLLVFLAQALWLVRCEIRSTDAPGEAEEARLISGWRQIHEGTIAGTPDPEAAAAFSAQLTRDPDGFDPDHSPLLALVTAAPMLDLPASQLNTGFSPHWRWLIRLPFIAVGVLLGASLWYVSRRLCGNTGGFLALTLYCFSPTMIQNAAVWHTDPEILVAWGSFGAIFTAIAVAHTLYAPREVILWNWRRILLLGVALAISVGAQFSMIVVVPVALAFMLYVAPIRRGAALVIWIAACLIAVMLLFATYFFQIHPFLDSMRHASFFGATWRAFFIRPVYQHVAMQIFRACPPAALLLPVAVAVYFAWPRTRYFGNTAPALVALLFLALGIAHPHNAGAGFLTAAIPFLFIFICGVIADLMETSYRPLITACVGGLLAAYVVWSLVALSHVPRG